MANFKFRKDSKPQNVYTKTFLVFIKKSKFLWKEDTFQENVHLIEVSKLQFPSKASIDYSCCKAEWDWWATPPPALGLSWATGLDTRILHGGEKKVKSFAHLRHQVIRKSWALVGKEAEKALETRAHGQRRNWREARCQRDETGVYVEGGRPEPCSGSGQVQPNILGQSNLLNRSFVPMM